MTTPRSDAEKLEREACKLFCIVFGAEEAREFEAMNPAIYNGWLRLARKLRKSGPKTCVWTFTNVDDHFSTQCGVRTCYKSYKSIFCAYCGGKIVTK
jgi:hypothetical protein